MTVSSEDLSSSSTEIDILGDIEREDVLDISFSLDFDSIKEDIGLTVNDVFDKMFGKPPTLLGDINNISDSNPSDPPPTQ